MGDLSLMVSKMGTPDCFSRRIACTWPCCSIGENCAIPRHDRQIVVLAAVAIMIRSIGSSWMHARQERGVNQDLAATAPRRCSAGDLDESLKPREAALMDRKTALCDTSIPISHADIGETDESCRPPFASVHDLGQPHSNGSSLASIPDDGAGIQKHSSQLVIRTSYPSAPNPDRQARYRSTSGSKSQSPFMQPNIGSARRGGTAKSSPRCSNRSAYDYLAALHLDARKTELVALRCSRTSFQSPPPARSLVIGLLLGLLLHQAGYCFDLRQLQIQHLLNSAPLNVIGT